jgi:hypothetical protein
LLLTISNSLPIKETLMLSPIMVSTFRKVMELYGTNHLLLTISHSLPIRETLMLSADVTFSFRKAMRLCPINHLASKRTQL